MMGVKFMKIIHDAKADRTPDILKIRCGLEDTVDDCHCNCDRR